MLSAPHPIFALEPGALVEIKYAVARDGGSTYRWLAGEVVECDADTWPLVRLSDGQFTEVRPYMTWRLVRAATRQLAA